MPIQVRPDGPLPNLISHIFGRCVRQGTCLVWTGASSRNQGQLTGGKYVHIIVYEHFKGKVPVGKEVGHTCDVGLCCEPEHLEAITRQQNVQDAFTRGRYNRGKYSSEEVKQLREGLIAVKEFAKKFNLTLKTVYNIKLGHKAKWR